MPLLEATEAVRDLAKLIDASPTPYHAVAHVREQLERQGYVALDERVEWQLGPGDRGYVVRGGGTILAFRLGTAPPSRVGFRVLGAHTDSPNLRIKPAGDRKNRGHRQLSVDIYGGVLLHTWLDRDLSIAGRVTLLDGSTHLVDLERPLCRIPNLAIHLFPTLATEGLKLNPQTHLGPTLGLWAEDASGLFDLVTQDLERRGLAGIEKEQIAGFDLCLYDTQGARVGGADDELLYAARLDNLASCHAAVSALLSRGEPAAQTEVVVLYDHEEIGSQSSVGAKSRFLLEVLHRLARGYPGAGTEPEARALARSFLISADMAHAVHPNYSDRHDPVHLPQLGRGPVIKVNANQAYATDGPGTAAFERACHDAGFSAQRFVSRNDYRCGSTIGPISAAQTGIRTVDVGSPMLSMHSCREMCGTADVPKMVAVLERMLAADAPPPND
jgi:aspartyl aminopeptidase